MRRVTAAIAVTSVLVLLPSAAGASPDPIRVEADGDVVITGTNGDDDVFVAASGGTARFFVNDFSLQVEGFDGGVTIAGRGGDDLIDVIGVAGDLVVSADGGNDLVSLGSDFGGEVRVVTGGGDDEVRLGAPLLGATFYGSVVANLGSGDDLLLFQSSTGQRLLANGQSGNDEVACPGLGTFGITDFKSFELVTSCP